MAPLTASPGVPDHSPTWPGQQIKAIIEIPAYLGLPNDDDQVFLDIQSRLPGTGKESRIGPSGLRKLNVSGLRQGDQIIAMLFHPERMKKMLVKLVADRDCYADVELSEARFWNYERTFLGGRKDVLLMLRSTRAMTKGSSVHITYNESGSGTDIAKMN